jgi:hypothetical protein
MLALMWPPAWLLLVLIIPVEGYFARRILSLDWRNALRLSIRANLSSTLVGIPLTWAVLVLVEIGTGIALEILKIENANVPRAVRGTIGLILFSPWLGPGDWGPWVVPAAAAYLCVPFYFASVLVENRVALRFLGALNASSVRKWSWSANGFSYSMIFAFLAAWAIGRALSPNATP